MKTSKLSSPREQSKMLSHYHITFHQTSHLIWENPSHLVSDFLLGGQDFLPSACRMPRVKKPSEDSHPEPGSARKRSTLSGLWVFIQLFHRVGDQPWQTAASIVPTVNRKEPCEEGERGRKWINLLLCFCSWCLLSSRLTVIAYLICSKKVSEYCI